MIRVAGGLTRNPADNVGPVALAATPRAGNFGNGMCPPRRARARARSDRRVRARVLDCNQGSVGTAQQTSHLLFEALKRCRLGVGAALRPRLGAGRGRTRAFAARGGRRRGLFQNSGLLEFAGHLHAGIEQLDCASRRQYNPCDNVPPASRLGGRRFRLIQAGRAKLESEASGHRKRTGSRNRRMFPYVVSFFLGKLRGWDSERHGCSSLVSGLAAPGIIPWIGAAASANIQVRSKSSLR